MKRSPYITTAFLVILSLLSSSTLLGQGTPPVPPVKRPTAATPPPAEKSPQSSARILREMREESASSVGSKSVSKSNSDTQAYRLEQFARSLPTSEATRQRQQEIEALNDQLTRATSQEQVQQILESIAAKSAEIENDPVNAQNMRMLADEFFPAYQMSSSALYRAAILGTPGPIGIDVAASTGAMSDKSAAAGGAVAATPRPSSGVDYSQLQPGDIMLIRHPRALLVKTVIYAMNYTHAGNYLGNQRVFESNEDGVRIKPLNDWKVKGACVAFGRNNKRSSSQVMEAVQWALERYGADGHTPYNYDYSNKVIDSKLYCSQLSWKIHKRLGVDIDSNDLRYVAYTVAKFGLLTGLVAKSAVAPDEIRFSSDIDFYAEGCN